ncbi:hypothetical protein ACSBR2_000016 [Camellia fascicularis]
MSLKELVLLKRSSIIEFNGREFDVSRPGETDENVVTIQKTTSTPNMETENSNVLRAEEIKLLANEAFKAHKYSQAIDFYTQAIELHSENVVYWGNRAIAHARLEDHGSAIQDASRAIEVDPKYSKSGKSAAIYACVKEQDFLVIEVRITTSWALANICDSLHHCINAVNLQKVFYGCFYLATSYSLARKRTEAYALYCRAHSLANDALKKLKSLTTADQVMIKELKMLYDDSRSNSCIEHATGIIEEEKAPENLSKKISTISLTGADIGTYY